MKALKYTFVATMAIGSLSLVGCSSGSMTNNAGDALDGYNNGYYSDYYNYGDGSSYGYDYNNGTTYNSKYGTMYNDGWSSNGNDWSSSTGYGTMYNGTYNWTMPYDSTNTVD